MEKAKTKKRLKRISKTRSNPSKAFTTPDDVIIFSAFRYALGRRTYVVGVVVDYIIENWRKFSIHDQERFVKEIKEQEKEFDLGMDMDKREWYRIVQLHEEKKSN